VPPFREDRLQGCSFCGRSAEEARGIVAGEGVGICDECVGLARAVLLERGVRAAPPTDRTARERSTGWLTSAQGVEPGEEVVVVDLTAELELEVVADDTPDVRWPAVGRPAAP
jgi:hypothetical protein